MQKSEIDLGELAEFLRNFLEFDRNHFSIILIFQNLFSCEACDFKESLSKQKIYPCKQKT